MGRGAWRRGCRYGRRRLDDPEPRRAAWLVGRDIVSVCKAPWQFSCWNKNDPNYPYLSGAKPISAREYLKAREAALAVIDGNQPDPTAGATHYHATTMARPPTWAAKAKRTAVIGRHVFFRDVPQERTMQNFPWKAGALLLAALLLVAAGGGLGVRLAAGHYRPLLDQAGQDLATCRAARGNLEGLAAGEGRSGGGRSPAAGRQALCRGAAAAAGANRRRPGRGSVLGYRQGVGAMRCWLVVVMVALAGCAGRQDAEPRTVRVEVPVLVPCRAPAAPWL
ncbi:Cell Wall Hydrolase [compost metagenome]